MVVVKYNKDGSCKIYSYNDPNVVIRIIELSPLLVEELAKELLSKKI
jgi:hypothetical protein